MKGAEVKKSFHANKALRHIKLINKKMKQMEDTRTELKLLGYNV